MKIKSKRSLKKIVDFKLLFFFRGGRGGEIVSWCFKSSQPERIISGLRETFTKRHLVERTNKAEIGSEEQSEKADSCRENFWNEMQLKGP